MSPEDLATRGFIRLPETLETALERFAGNDTVTGWLPDGFAELYRAHKASEIAHVAEMDVTAQCAAYARTY